MVNDIFLTGFVMPHVYEYFFLLSRIGPEREHILKSGYVVFGIFVIVGRL